MDEVQKFLIKSGEEITLRPAEAADAEGIIRALKSFAPERSYVLMELYGKETGAEREYISALDRNKNLLLVGIAGYRGPLQAETGKSPCVPGCDCVIGILEALQADGGHRPETAQVLNVGLHLIEEFRGLGIGSRMLQYAEEWAREHGFKEIETTVFTANKRSLNLFRKAGFLQECTKVKRIRIGNEFVDEVIIGKRLE